MKTKFMIFHNKNKKIQNIVPAVNIILIERVQNFNYLGIVINEQLNWNTHIDILRRKISRQIGIFYKLKHFLPCSVLKTLYHCFLLPFCTYGILVWGSNTSRLSILQKKALRIITNSKYNSHTNPLFKSTQFLKVADIFKLQALKFYFQHCHNQLPFFLQQIPFSYRSDIHLYYTRNKTSLNTNRTKTKSANASLRNFLPKIINDSPQCTINKIHRVQGFAFYTKQYYISSYDAECHLVNCYICSNA